MVKIVYILVSSPQDYFLEQTMLSAYSAKRYNPNVQITVLADQDTARTVVGNREKIKEYVTEIKTVNVPEHYNMMQRSRFLKTSIPKYVDGDFIYMDSDTVVAGSLDDVYEKVQHLGLIRDENLEEYGDFVKKWISGNCRMLGWHDLSQEKGYNGGVLVVKRTSESEQFFNHWHKNWLECCSKGYDRDQLALTKANIECNYIIEEIDGKFNCQVARFEADKYKDDVRIIHYYDLSKCYHIYNDLKLWNRFRKETVIPQEFVDAVNNPQDVFAHRYIKAYNNDISFLHSDWHRVYSESMILQKCLLKINLLVCDIWRAMRQIKTVIKRK